MQSLQNLLFSSSFALFPLAFTNSQVDISKSRFIDESNVPGAHQVEKVEVQGIIYGSWTSTVQPHHKYLSISFHYIKTVILSL